MKFKKEDIVVVYKISDSHYRPKTIKSIYKNLVGTINRFVGFGSCTGKLVYEVNFINVSHCDSKSKSLYENEIRFATPQEIFLYHIYGSKALRKRRC